MAVINTIKDIKEFKALKIYQEAWVVDLETTGFGSGGGWLGRDILTWSVTRLDHNLNEIEKKTFKSKPESIHTWSDEAQEYHGITFYEAMQFPSKKEFLLNLMNYIKYEIIDKNKEIVWVEHSIDWIDWNFTQGAFMQAGLLEKFRKVFNFRCSTIRLARKAGYKSNSLPVWAERLNYPLIHHNSESDSGCTAELLKLLASKSSGTLFDFI